MDWPRLACRGMGQEPRPPAPGKARAVTRQLSGRRAVPWRRTGGVRPACVCTPAGTPEVFTCGGQYELGRVYFRNVVRAASAVTSDHTARRRKRRAGRHVTKYDPADGDVSREEG